MSRTPDVDETALILGRGVFELRKLLGWTQAELGRRAGVSQGLVSKVERGRLGDLTFATATRLLAAMGARLTVGIQPPYVGGRLQADAGHASCSGMRRDDSSVGAGWSQGR